MSVITIFSGIFCEQEAVVDDLVAAIGYQHLTQDEIVAQASAVSDMDESKIKRAFSPKTSVFNQFTQEKERAIAALKLALARLLAQDNLIITGRVGLLIPRTISHVLRVCLIGEAKHRQAVAASRSQLTEKEARKQIHAKDREYGLWTEMLYGLADPWDNSLYDLVLPMHTLGPASASSAIEENLLKSVLRPNAASQQALEDFALAAQISVALANQGHTIEVQVNRGDVTLVANKNVLRLNRLDEELQKIVKPLPGVRSVTTTVGGDFHQSDIYRKTNFQMPSKVLLVDDEREFVQTLSERLNMRDMGSAVVYDGREALDLLREDRPEVIVIDLKMPYMDGFEVLKKVKADYPEIEVIVLTGHGSEEDRATCMQLGAYAYMQKPVDIEELSAVLKEANAKISQKAKDLSICP